MLFFILHWLLNEISSAKIVTRLCHIFPLLYRFLLSFFFFFFEHEHYYCEELNNQDWNCVDWLWNPNQLRPNFERKKTF